MVSLKSRKRRRSQAFLEQDAVPQEDTSLDPSDSAVPIDEVDASGSPPADDQGDSASPERLEKEQGIWDAFREEYYEALEQLPLSLQRSFSLIKELDTQASSHGEELLSSLQTYLQLRGSTIQSRPDETKGQSAETQSSRDTDLTMLVTTPVEEEAPRLLRRSSTRSPAKNGSRSPSKPQTRPRSPIPAPPSEPLSPRQRNAQLLTKVAQLSEDLVRAGNEKINVARYANDIVNRHIKDLERAIKEQETSISLGLRPGTHPASIILPELVIPKSRPPGTVHDDLSDSDENTRDVTEEPPQDSVQDVVEEEKPMKTPRKKGRVKHPRKKSDVEVADQENVEVDKAEASDGRPSRSSRSLKLTLPALSAINSQKDTVIDSDEPRYCYCNQVSYGEMIGCDGPECKYEWFHIDCVGLAKLPPSESNWYCPDCSKTLGSKRRKGR